MHIISKPEIPHAYAIRESLHTGSEINITGHVTHRYFKDFTVDLLSGEHIVLHINFRFHLDQQRVIMNSKVYGVWGIEHDYHNPLHNDDKFHLKIHVHQNYYHITLNGKHLADFPHRKPIQTVQAIGLQGCVHIEDIVFTGFEFGLDWNDPHDYGHCGYLHYGTDKYEAPKFSDNHILGAHFQ